jgi:hypothetical protein
MAAHRYWRVIYEYGPSAFTTFGTRSLEFATSLGGSDACVGGAGISSGPSTNIANAFDGNATTFYTQTVIAESFSWLGYDFGSAIEILECRYTSYALSSSKSPWNICVEWSDDGLVWKSTSKIAAVRSDGIDPDGTVYTINGWAESELFSVTAESSRFDSDWTSYDQNIVVSPDTGNYNPIDSGPYKIVGNVFVDDTPDIPVRRKVRLFNLIDGNLAREVWSDAVTGAYLFTGIALRDYFVVSHDHTGTYNAVIKDRVTPEPI